ncbi:MSMEG_1061 family FMN-dependent PPOX-type flavoprotein [Qipengyuania sp. MTN3-11]|uniref:MSMEG_1061 family FMN-dependent PPOX-type flavoprotein n=1 Tax=Qipengyuania sp. MTN3-11 TaxID=3056557 RepID=UPI0036F31776
MRKITDVSELDGLYDPPVPAALAEVSNVLTPLYRRWIGAARFVVISTVGPESTDGSPRGDVDPVARIGDEKTIFIPDWRGNNRLDTLRNIVSDGRASLMFMIPGCENVVRVNGSAVVTNDTDLLRTFEKAGKAPCTVIALSVGEVYFQCAKALMRSKLWSGQDLSNDVPTAGEFIRE